MPSTGQTRTEGGKTQWWWGTTWHTVPPPQGGGTASGGTVTPPPAPTPQAPPLDPTAAARADLLTKNFNDQNAGFDAQEQTLRKRYGLDDDSDPYSQLRLLKQSFENRKRGSVNSLAARGQLYSGAQNNAATANGQFYDQSYDTLRKAQTDALARVAQQRAGAKFNYDSGILDTQQATIQTGTQNPPNPTDYQPPLSAPTAPKPPSPQGAALRRSQRRSIGITDIRNASSRQVRRARSLGYL